MNVLFPSVSGFQLTFTVWVTDVTDELWCSSQSLCWRSNSLTDGEYFPLAVSVAQQAVCFCTNVVYSLWEGDRDVFLLHILSPTPWLLYSVDVFVLCLPQILTGRENQAWARQEFEPRTSHTLSENHTPGPKSHEVCSKSLVNESWTESLHR